MKTPRCHIPGASASGTHIRLPEAEAHHVRHVLRLGDGDALRVFDGRGREWNARIERAGRHDVDVVLLDSVTPVPESPVAVTLAVGLLKGDQMSTVVRDATALGVSRIIPLASAHVVVPAAARQTGFIDRLTRIASSSAAQCGRAVVPEILGVTAFADVFDTPAAPAPHILCVEPALAVAETAAVPPLAGQATVLIGPEGGWSTEEITRARAAGAVFWSLGPRTLRAELAPAVALAVLTTPAP